MKRLNCIFLILICSTFALCQNSEKREGERNGIQKVNIKAVDVSILSTIEVKCHLFEDYFKEFDTISISDPNSLGKLEKILHNLELVDSNYSKTIDTRFKIELISKDNVNVICVGKLSLMKEMNIYKTPKELVEFVEELFKD